MERSQVKILLWALGSMIKSYSSWQKLSDLSAIELEPNNLAHLFKTQLAIKR
jgi:hypothetical protein